MSFSPLISKSWIFSVGISMGFMLAYGCDENAPKTKKDSPPAPAPAPAPAQAPTPGPSPSPEPTAAGNSAPTSPSPTPSNQSADSGSWSVGPGIEGCASQGKVWIAVGKDGGPGFCDEKEAKMCCTEQEILNRFKEYSSLASDIQKAKATGAKLYQCSTDGSGKTLFHFAGMKGGSVVYQFLGVPQSTAVGAPPANCPRPSMADLGFTSTSSGSSGTGSGTSTSTRTTP